MQRPPQLLTLMFNMIVAVAIASQQNVENIRNEPSSLDASPIESGIFLAGSALAAASVASIPLRSCIFSGKCRENLDSYRKQFLQKDLDPKTSSKSKRNVNFIEPVLAALLDTFVENEMKAVRHSDMIDNEVYPRQQPEPTLVTLARYFDKYADEEVKKHVKAGLFFIVHILGRVYWYLQSFIRMLVDYGML